MIEENGTAILAHITGVITGNPRIWIPVLAAWMLGFILTRYLNSTHLKRRSDREFRVYSVNGVAAFLLYLLFNYQNGFQALPQATLAAAVAVLLPAVWFWWRRGKDNQ